MDPALAGGMPSFDLGNGMQAGGGAIDWQAPAAGGWNAGYSPYAQSAIVPSATPNFVDFLMKLVKGQDEGQGAGSYDSLGSDLLGKKKSSR